MHSIYGLIQFCCRYFATFGISRWSYVDGVRVGGLCGRGCVFCGCLGSETRRMLTWHSRLRSICTMTRVYTCLSRRGAVVEVRITRQKITTEYVT